MYMRRHKCHQNVKEAHLVDSLQDIRKAHSLLSFLIPISLRVKQGLRAVSGLRSCSKEWAALIFTSTQVYVIPGAFLSTT